MHSVSETASLAPAKTFKQTLRLYTFDPLNAARKLVAALKITDKSPSPLELRKQVWLFLYSANEIITDDDNAGYPRSAFVDEIIDALPAALALEAVHQ